MEKKAGKARRKRRGRRAPAVVAPGRAQDLKAESRALLGRDDEQRPMRPAQDDASVQDPLGDWPEE